MNGFKKLFHTFVDRASFVIDWNKIKPPPAVRNKRTWFSCSFGTKWLTFFFFFFFFFLCGESQGMIVDANQLETIPEDKRGALLNKLCVIKLNGGFYHSFFITCCYQKLVD